MQQKNGARRILRAIRGSDVRSGGRKQVPGNDHGCRRSPRMRATEQVARTDSESDTTRIARFLVYTLRANDHGVNNSSGNLCGASCSNTLNQLALNFARGKLRDTNLC